MIKGFKDFLAEGGSNSEPSLIDAVFVPARNAPGKNEYQHLEEGKWVDGRFEKNIRIDQPAHGVGQQHAHIYGRKGEQIGILNLDGSASHGSKMRLHKKDMAVLSARGFDVPDDGIVEWRIVEGGFILLEN